MANTALNRTTVALLTNKSGGNLAYGDVVVLDNTNAKGFTTTTTGALATRGIGVIIEPNGIANNATGLVATGGWIPKVTLNTAATIGQFIKTHTVAGQATPHDSPQVTGDFGVALQASATPEAILFGSANMPVTGATLGDGDYGDITVSSSGTVLSIDADTITTTELANNAVETANITDGHVTVAKLSTGAKTGQITVTIDGGGSAITTGIKGDLEIPIGVTLTAVRMLADQSGSIVVDIWKDSYANYPPTDADSITASAVPTISTATKSEDTTLTGWTTSITAGDILRFNVDSATTITRVQISLRFTKA
jgi:hypothetical protein